MLLRLAPDRLPRASSTPLETTPAATASQGQEIAAESRFERMVAAGETHRYWLILNQGDFFHLEVAQHGVDVSLSYRDATGAIRLEVDSPNGDRGVEQLATIATEDGRHQVEVVAGSSAGRYALKVVASRPASFADQQKAEIALAYASGEGQRRTGGREKTAVAAYRQVEKLALAAGDLRGRALALNRIGQLAESLGQSAGAVEAYQTSRSLFGSLDDSWEQALLFYRIGRLQRQAGHLRDALRSYRSALSLFEQEEDPWHQASTLNDLGLVYVEMGGMQEAIDRYRRALTLWCEAGDSRSQAVTLKNLADVYAALRYNERAVDLLEQALALRRATADELGEALALKSLATAQRRMGAYPEALDSQVLALDLMRRQGDRQGEGVVLNSLGLTYFLLGELDRARDAYRQALGIAREIGARSDEAYARVNLGWLEEEQGQLDLALQHYQAAVATFRELGDVMAETSALFGLGRVQRSLGSLGAARSFVEAALARIERVRGGVFSERAQSEFLADRHHYYEFLIDLLIEMEEKKAGSEWDAVALQVSEQGRARSLLDLLKRSQMSFARGVDSELLDQERRVAAELQDVELKRLRSERAGLAQADLRDALDRLTVDLDDLRGRIRAQSPSYAEIVLPQAPKVGEIRQFLDEETLLLVISPGKESSILWLVGRELLVHRRLPSREELETQAKQAHGLLAKSQIPLFRESARRVLEDLSEKLLGPVADLLVGKRLAVVADGALQLIPFAALPLPDATPGAGQPLMTRFEVVQLPSIAVLRFLRQREASRPPAPGILAVVGDPVFDPGDPRVARYLGGETDADAATAGFSLSWLRSLPSSRLEAEAILALVPAEDRFAALGLDARLHRVIDGELRDFRILHFATHGLLNHEHPDLSGIALSQVDSDGKPQSGILWAYQIYGLDLPAELVVLSACQTALGKEVRGEGMLGLTRGFMHAGATRVVVSLWAVSDRATAELMTRFYKSLFGRGLSASAALRDAQLSLLAEEPWSAPYYWAGFVIQGDWL